MRRGEWTSNSDNVSLMKEKKVAFLNAFKKERGDNRPTAWEVRPTGHWR